MGRVGPPPAAAGLAGTAVFAASVLALHGVRPDLDPVSTTISQYAVGAHGWVLRAALLADGAGALVTASRLLAGTGRVRWPGAGLLAAYGVAVAAVGVFVVDGPGAPATTGGRLHVVAAATAFVVLPAATGLVGRDLRRRGMAAGAVLELLAVAQLGALLAFVLSPAGLSGATERVLVALQTGSLALLQRCDLRAATARA